MDFLPITKQEMLARGWEACDFVYVIGDAYVDHPSFGHAIISRVLERTYRGNNMDDSNTVTKDTMCRR